jgi:hypothetical protein
MASEGYGAVTHRLSLFGPLMVGYGASPRRQAATPRWRLTHPTIPARFSMLGELGDRFRLVDQRGRIVGFDEERLQIRAGERIEIEIQLGDLG